MPKLTPTSFTKRVKELIQEQEPTARIDMPEALRLIIRKPGHEEYKSYLANAYANYQNTPDRVKQITTDYVSAICVALNLDMSSLNVNQIVPVIKDWQFIEETRKTIGVSGTPDDDIAQVFERYNDSLVVLYAEDAPQTITYPSWEMVAEAGLEMADLRTLAVNNLQRILPPIECLTHDNSLYAITAGSYFETSLILSDSFWQERKLDVDGDYVIAIPARGMLFVTGSNHNETIQMLRMIALQAAQESAYPLTNQLYIYDGEKFVEH